MIRRMRLLLALVVSAGVNNIVRIYEMPAFVVVFESLTDDASAVSQETPMNAIVAAPSAGIHDVSA